MADYRIGLIGLGKIAIESHLRAFQSLPDVTITALVDTVESRAVEVAKLHAPDAKVSTEIADILDHVDAVIISTPNFTHAELASQCMNAGKHVLVEKPMTTTLQDAKLLCDLASEKQVVLAAGYFMRFLPTVEKVRQIILKQTFGKPVRFLYRFGSKGGWSPLSGYTMDRKSVGGGSLVVLGTHLLDLILHWFGYPETIELMDDSLGGPEAIANARLSFNDGTINGEVLTSKTVFLQEGCAIEFENGILLFDSYRQSPLVFRPFSDEASEYTITDLGGQAPLNLFRLQAEDFVNACRLGCEPRVSGKVGYDNVRILEALYHSRQPLDEHWYNTPQALSETAT